MELKKYFNFESRKQTDPADTGHKKESMTKIQLIGYGLVEAKRAKEIKPGDTLVWNYGVTSLVDSIEKETRTQIVIRTIAESGKTYTRRMGKERLVGVML